MTTKTEAKHTPGPWKVIYPSDVSISRQGVDSKVIGIWAQDVCLDIAFLRENDGNETNARLIALAPELLERLKQAVEIINDLKSETHTVNITGIESAIAKAEGGELK